MSENNNWGFSQIWNESLLDREERELKVRDNIWASELGKAPIDVWLKMRATKMTNPPNARSLRKFEAGNVFEWIVSLILKRAGILRASQNWCKYQYPDLISVTGKADFIAGGKPNKESWKKDLEILELPDVFVRAGDRIIDYLLEKYPNGLDEMPLEIKSVGAFMYDALERKGSSSKIHRMQAFHYLKAEDRPKANLVYICRDDLRMMEFPITNPSSVEDEYKGGIEIISKYHEANERPPLESPIVFDDDIGKFAKNFNVAYSSYLTMLYGYKDQMHFDNAFTPIVSKWNRVLGRIKEGKDMTANNKEVLSEIEKSGFNVEEIKSRFVDEKVEEKETLPVVQL